MDDGFKTTISFALQPAVKFWEKEVTPPSLQGGGATATSTMRNNLLRTFAPKKLITMGESSATCAWDPAVYPQLLTMINKNQLITVTFPDGDTVAFWGWLDDFTPGPNVEGEQPTADITVICSNQNDAGVETNFVHTPAA